MYLKTGHFPPPDPTLHDGPHRKYLRRSRQTIDNLADDYTWPEHSRTRSYASGFCLVQLARAVQCDHALPSAMSLQLTNRKTFFREQWDTYVRVRLRLDNHNPPNRDTLLSSLDGNLGVAFWTCSWLRKSQAVEVLPYFQQSTTWLATIDDLKCTMAIATDYLLHIVGESLELQLQGNYSNRTTKVWGSWTQQIHAGEQRGMEGMVQTLNNMVQYVQHRRPDLYHQLCDRVTSHYANDTSMPDSPGSIVSSPPGLSSSQSTSGWSTRPPTPEPYINRR